MIFILNASTQISLFYKYIYYNMLSYIKQNNKYSKSLFK